MSAATTPAETSAEDDTDLLRHALAHLRLGGIHDAGAALEAVLADVTAARGFCDPLLVGRLYLVLIQLSNVDRVLSGRPPLKQPGDGGTCESILRSGTEKLRRAADQLMLGHADSVLRGLSLAILDVEHVGGGCDATTLLTLQRVLCQVSNVGRVLDGLEPQEITAYPILSRL